MSRAEKFCFSTTGDFELGFEHITRETEYSIVLPDSEPKGLVVYIPGFGGDSGDYRHKFCEKISEKYGLAVMTVDYHCLFSRPVLGAKTVYEKQDYLMIEKLFVQYGLPLGAVTDIDDAVNILNEHLAKIGKEEQMLATLKPAKNEYQNGGILAALDNINAVGDALKRWGIPEGNIILIGSSYGGYIANLATKLAPNTFRAVFDNSSWANPNLDYIMGRELLRPEYSGYHHSNIQTCYFVRSGWTLETGLPNTFDENRMAIRDFTLEQVQQFSTYKPNTFYYFMHCVNDHIADTDKKIALAMDMLECGMTVHMLVMDKEDIDGQYVKNIDHGMGLSMVRFFESAYQHIETHPPSEQTNFSKQSLITYQTPLFQYVFDYASLPVSARVVSL
ncbi:MAG: hypothetical protein ISEC1_P0082 [Thiomicrorhabdus sp.]|nr:MAG: hypothetical protein ISEC1_P0082 [Thiomicrorhabdus sp.]